MISDEDIVASLQSVGMRRCTPEPSPLDYDITDVRGGNGTVEFVITVRDGLRARVRLDLPSSGKFQPWLYEYPDNADEWVQQLLTWTDEEVFTLGLGASRARKAEDGESFVIAEPYGWRLADTAEHEARLASAGPFGWHGNVYAEKEGH
ncbi:hypothetical protein [Lacisediminihabitans profunda]|uniref:Uncharacterized protein n=1 Tax=Lacisediminihabitans profunda TaxID=2594790 RepID=A0A5C8UL00_9MICO|nr:hypothetical protein [Lacisediminihabitans profunda]TXN27895.1 hypothetical protein FVP33_18755 [Lacisediminihabitans profunda]